LRAVDELQFDYPRSSLGRVTLSMGGVVHESLAYHEQPTIGGVPSDLIEAAEHAVHRAKAAGGHRAEIIELSDFSDPQPRSYGLRA